MDDSTIWKLIDIYFKENSHALVRHHLDSYNQFFTKDLYQLFKEMNPLKIEVDYDDELQEFRSKCRMYIGGKDGSLIYFGKPIVYDPKNSHYMFPNECRLRNLTYATTVHFDVEIEYERILREDDIPTRLDEKGYALFDGNDEDEHNATKEEDKGKLLKKNYTPSEFAEMRKNTTNNIRGNVQLVKMRLEKIYFGKFPIMVQSELCVLHKMPRDMRYAMGECKNDLGGYFIIDGKEKVVIPQEGFGDNMINVSKSKDEKYLYTVDVKSVSENVSKPVRTLSIRILAPTKALVNKNIGVFIPNAGDKPIPLFIVFRALGILTDKEIISFCTLQNAEDTPIAFMPYIDSCIHNASAVVTQHDAITFISLLVKGRSITRTMRILADYFLPHIGEVNFLDKAYYLGYLVNRLLSVATGIEEPTDRDSYKFKRLSLIGPLMKDLFREYYVQQQHHIRLSFETKYEFGKKTFSDLSVMIYKLYAEVFRKRIVETGFQKAFKGRWGATEHTKKVGIVQDLTRLSFNGMMDHLRKTSLPMDSSVKLVAPRVLHGSQWGIVDPIDTPDGANIGLHKHLAMLTLVTTSISREPILKWLRTNTTLKELSNTTPIRMGKMTKIFVNGLWVGGVTDPIQITEMFKLHRRHGLIPVSVNIMFDHVRNTIFISADGGRLCRPIFYRDMMSHSRSFVFQNKDDFGAISKLMEDPKSSDLWLKMISGFHTKNDATFNPYSGKFYTWEELYKLDKAEIKKSKALLEYVDPQETEGTLIALHNSETTSSSSHHTHCEIHPSTTYGVMCNLINYLEHNPVTRNSFSCGQSKQACSLYSTNYQLRMDKTAVVLNNGQIPLVKSRYLQYINHEENPYGENAIVAIMCYTGYNVEDAILINEGALQRGLFRTTIYTTYEAEEEKEVKHDIVLKDKTFGNIDKLNEVMGIKPDMDYSKLDVHGIIPENTEVDDRTVLIGQTEMADQKGGRKDCSKVPKKGQLGTVDKTFMTEGEEGQRIAKVRIREERIPNIGDKFASRAGQKGTIGMVIPEANMPFTKDGIRPDMIINPHALPSRMTIGQMIECIVGKGCAHKGTFGDCTAFYNRENKLALFGDVLMKHKFHSNGDEILYNGMNGKQLEASVFIGPTYYMRLKHMVKDKINHRARGPRTNLTRQPVSGRANDGGLRIGEMERDAVISHGMSYFLRESMMERADAYQMAVCNHSGMMAIYNPTRDILLSPGVDGPIKYTGSLFQEGQQEVQQISKYGKSFSLVQLPYSMKLLIQELQAMNIQVRIITEDNIKQIENLNFSHNLKLLMGDKDATPKMVIEIIKDKLDQTQKEYGINDTDVTPEQDKYGIAVKKGIVNERDKYETQYERNEIDVEELTRRLDAAPPNHAGPKFNIMNYINTDIQKERRMEREKERDARESIKLQPVPRKITPPRKETDFTQVWSGSPRDSYETASPAYSPTSPAYDPTTPEEYSPPYDPNKYSPPYSVSDNQNQQGGRGLKIQDEVHYRGDQHKARIWTIKSKGNNLCTIETPDEIKVVRPDEIYRAGEYNSEVQPGYYNTPDQYQYQNLSQELQYPPQYYQDPSLPLQTQHMAMPVPSINIAPVIKVFHDGNDMSSSRQQSDTGENINDNRNQNMLVEQTPFADKNVVVDDEMIDFSKPILINKA